MKANVSKKKKTKNNWRLPKNAADFFDPHYDDSFKAAHPLLYWLTVFAIIVGVMIGPAVFLLLCSAVQTTDSLTNAEFVIWVIGFVLSFGISIGIINIFMLLHKQYLGHYVTLFSLVIGSIGSGAALLTLWLI